jgi:hypothetical protein
MIWCRQSVWSNIILGQEHAAVIFCFEKQSQTGWVRLGEKKGFVSRPFVAGAPHLRRGGAEEEEEEANSARGCKKVLLLPLSSAGSVSQASLPSGREISLFLCSCFWPVPHCPLCG